MATAHLPNKDMEYRTPESNGTNPEIITAMLPVVQNGIPRISDAPLGSDAWLAAHPG
ncbi:MULTISPECIES: hypothetical protein [unclassified Nocardia]|uniref:hypothetical protein n=1 Tax=unclassified Nocardia TaxID=2637762 RepID=UPI001CE46F90|nr:MULTISPECIES: hypothetical protein [unclassified Nocardia]